MNYWQLVYLKKLPGPEGYEIVTENWDNDFNAQQRQVALQSDPDLKNFAMLQKPYP